MSGSTQQLQYLDILEDSDHKQVGLGIPPADDNTRSFEPWGV